MEPNSDVVIMSEGFGRVFHHGPAGVEEIAMSPDQIAEWADAHERHFDELAALKRKFIRAAGR